MGGGDVHGSHLRMMLGSLWNTFTYYIIYIYIYRERERYILYIFSRSLIADSDAVQLLVCQTTCQQFVKYYGLGNKTGGPACL